MSAVSSHFLPTALLAVRTAGCIAGIYYLWPWRRRPAGEMVRMTAQGVRVVPGGDGSFRTRLVLCLFLSGAVCFGLFSVLIRPSLPSAPPQPVAADRVPLSPPPRTARSSTARDGDIVKIVCGGKLCAVAATEQDSVKLPSQNTMTIYQLRGKGTP